MEPVEALIIKVDALTEVSRASLEISRDTLAEIKRLGDATAIQVAHHDKELHKLDGKIDDGLREASNARKSIYGRLEKLERECAKNHGKCSEHLGSGELFDPEAWWAKKVVRWAVVIGGPVLTFLATKLVEQLF